MNQTPSDGTEHQTAGAIPGATATIIPNSGCMNTEWLEVMIEKRNRPQENHTGSTRAYPLDHPSLCVFQDPQLILDLPFDC